MSKIYLVIFSTSERSETILESYVCKEKAEKRVEQLNGHFVCSPTEHLPVSRLEEINLIED